MKRWEMEESRRKSLVGKLPPTVLQHVSQSKNIYLCIQHQREKFRLFLFGMIMKCLNGDGRSLKAIRSVLFFSSGVRRVSFDTQTRSWITQWRQRTTEDWRGASKHTFRHWHFCTHQLSSIKSAETKENQFAVPSDTLKANGLRLWQRSLVKL